MKSLERTFLHDLANILALSYGNMEFLLDSLKKKPHEDPKVMERAEKVFVQLEKAKVKLSERRLQLRAEEENT